MTWTFEDGRFRDSETGQFISLNEVLERRHRRRDLAIATFSLLVAIAGLAASIELTRRQNDLAIQAFSDQQISSAWQILAINGAGSTGKRYALEVLLKPDQPISGVDLSCRKTESNRETAGVGYYECDAPTDLRGLQIGSERTPAPNTVQLQRTDLTGADLSSAEIYGSAWQGVTLDGATMLRTVFSGVRMTEMAWRVSPWMAANPQIIGGHLSYVDFTRSDLTLFSFVDVTFAGDFNISNTLFCTEEGTVCATGIKGEFFKGAWFYADMPPMGLARVAPAGTKIFECTQDWSDSETEQTFAEAYDIARFDPQLFRPIDCVKSRRVDVGELPISGQDLLLD